MYMARALARLLLIGLAVTTTARANDSALPISSAAPAAAPIADSRSPRPTELERRVVHEPDQRSAALAECTLQLGRRERLGAVSLKPPPRAMPARPIYGAGPGAPGARTGSPTDREHLEGSAGPGHFR
jgi:hypothetical protein